MTIKELNEKIQSLVDVFNQEHNDNEIIAKILADDSDVAIHYINKPRMRAEWVEWMMRRYKEDSRAYPLTIDYFGEVVVVKVSNHGIGTAVCGHDDSFDEDTGIAIAYARALREEVPDYM